jgi:tRNA pseudouridine55 synthase
MARRKNNLAGLLLVNKPRGITSHDVVDIVRRRLGMRKVGHAGTLDPLANGLLIILVGAYTKMFNRFVNFDKEYIGIMQLGTRTTTGDSQGEILQSKDYDDLSSKDIEEVFSQFRGVQEQVPPMVSARKFKGKRLYKLARAGVTVKRQPREVNIKEIKVLDTNLPSIKFYVHCSKGTYVRQLAEDIGQKLGSCAHITSINRLSIGPFSVDEAVSPEQVTARDLKLFND